MGLIVVLNAVGFPAFRAFVFLGAEPSRSELLSVSFRTNQDPRLDESRPRNLLTVRHLLVIQPYRLSGGVSAYNR